MAKRKQRPRAAGKRAKRAAGKRAPTKRKVRRSVDEERYTEIKNRKRREREYDDWLYEGYEVEMSVDLYGEM